MSELVTTEALNADAGDWETGLRLVGEWLLEHKGHTLAAYADAIGWPYVIAPGKRRGEWRGYITRQSKTWLAWCHSNGVHLFDAQRLHALAWVHAVNSTGMAKNSRAQLLSAASSFYLWAIEEGHTERNPVAAVNRGKQGLRTSNDDSPTRSLTVTEAQAMLRAADTDPVQDVRLRSAAIVALLVIGPRVSEICRAKLADMVVMDGRRALHLVLKGGKDHWKPLPPTIAARIDAYLASRRDLDLLPARRDGVSASSAPLIATASGKPLGRGEVRALVKRLAVRAGLDDPAGVSPHAFRHTYITEARRQGHATAEIQHDVGHAFSSTTDRYGTHIIALERSPAYGVAAAFEPQ